MELNPAFQVRASVALNLLFSKGCTFLSTNLFSVRGLRKKEFPSLSLVLMNAFILTLMLLVSWGTYASRFFLFVFLVWGMKAGSRSDILIGFLLKGRES